MKGIRSSSQYQFSQVPSANIQRSVFNRSHGYKTTFDAGYLVPFYVDEALPGDTFNLNATMFARLATPIVPIMDNMYLDTFYFAVPIRLVWDNFQRMMGERPNPGDSIDFLVPQIESGEDGFAPLSVSDYFGLPTDVPNLSVSALWHRCYNLCWNEWFRDQNLQAAAPVSKGDGPDPVSDTILRRRGKRHDYFTSALPWPQKGDDIDLPLGSIAPVVGTGARIQFRAGVDDPLQYPVASSTGSLAITNPPAASNTEMYFREGSQGYLQVDLADATAASINSLREAFQLQKMLERDARGGTRYIEIIRSHFNVVSPDARLQRPEYLGGGSSPVVINPVAQTSETQGPGTPQGTLAGYGTVGSNRNGFTKSFTEHTLIIGLMCVRADLTYQSGVPRMFSRRSRYDFYWPSLAHLGEQAVLNKEIYAQGTAADDEVFGYQEIWAEYRYYPSKITGKFRSSDPESLDVWHLSQDFESLPVLSSEFIQEEPPVERVIAIPSEPHFIFDSIIESRTARPMPTYSVPGLIDHF